MLCRDAAPYPASALPHLTRVRLRAQAGGSGAPSGPKGPARRRLLPKEVAAVTVMGLLAALIAYTVHCVWVSADMYSAPSIVLQTRYVLFQYDSLV